MHPWARIARRLMSNLPWAKRLDRIAPQALLSVSQILLFTPPGVCSLPSF
jgi:hypothetical protein